MPKLSNGLESAIASQPALPTWITHLWQRLHDHNRLGLILGAGVSADAGCPLWPELVNRIGAQRGIRRAVLTNHRKAGLSDSYLAEILFLSHQADERGLHKAKIKQQFVEYQVNSSWVEIVHKCIYERIMTTPISTIFKKHRYLESLGKLVYASGFTVNFNFDDIVDEAVFSFAKAQDKPNPEIIFHPKTDTRRSVPIIYHINGFLPREEIRRRSEKLILTEEAFAEILISPNSAVSEFAINQFATRTFLILGCSLNDNSLKNMLRAGSERSAGNHHYVVYHEQEGSPRSSKIRQQIFDVNINVYNAISIFLTTLEITSLINILNTGRDKIDSKLSQIAKGKVSRKYYLVGSVAAGKSSTLEALRCFSTYEEWTGRLPAVMYKDNQALTAAEQTEIDEFLYPQLAAKNERLRAAGPGIHIMDRAYLDLFAFSKSDAENRQKAGEIQNKVVANLCPLEDGQILFVRADQEALEERLAKRGQKKYNKKLIFYDSTGLLRQEELLRKIYRVSDKELFDTTRQNVAQIARKVARKILLSDYKPFQFQKRLNKIINSGGAI